MRKSLESLLSANRRAFFVMGSVLCLGVFGFIAWQAKAQENPNAGSLSDSQKQIEGIRLDDKAQREPVNNEAYVIELPGKIDRASLPTGPGLGTLMVGTDQGVEIEPNNTFATATNLPGSEVKIRGDIFGNGDLDWFSFTAAAGDRVYAAVMTSYSSSASTDSQLRIFASDGTTVLEFDEDDGSLGGLSSTIAGVTITAGGTYYAQVKHFSATNTLRPYELYLKVQSGAPTLEVEPNDTQATANPLPMNGWVSGARNPAVATEQDWYSMTLNAGDTVYLGLDLDPERDNVQWNGRLGLALFGDANNQILVVDDASVGSVANPLSEAFYMTVKTAGTYYAFVDSATAATGGPTATYNLSVTVIPKTNVGINCTTYTSTNVPLAIADGALTSSTITVPATMGRIASTKVSINATHTLMADMDVNLRSPNTNDNGLFNDIGPAATGGQTMMDITLDQYSSGVPFAFTIVRPLVLKPELNYRLDWFDGENPSGVWTLDIRDDLVNATTGTLNAWSLEICEQPPVAGSVIYTEDFEANNGGYTLGTVGQLANEWEYGTPATVGTTTANPVASIIGCNSGTNCWKTDLDNTYEVSSNQDLVSPNILLPNQNGTATLTWAMRYQFESATFDRARVTINEVGGMGLSRTVWQWTGATMTVAPGTPIVNIGESAGWGIYQAKIDDFANFAGRTINITFHVESDTSINFAGLAIDDVQLRFVPVGVNADLSITKTDGVTTVTPGQMITYTIVASNAGPSPVTGATVTDTFPAALTGVTWTCVGAGGGTCTGAGAGNINDTVNLPVGGSVTYTANATVNAAATFGFSNTARVAAPMGTTDPVPGNNSARDTDAVCPPLTFSNTGTIAIPATGTTSGISNPYPSNIAVAGLTGTVTDVNVNLNGLNHTFPDDMDMLLVGPAGQNAIILSDVGTSLDVVNVNLTLDDAAATSLPDAAQIVSGTFRPTNIGVADAFAAPAPAPAGGSLLSIFDGTAPNGTWSLYIVDDLGGDSGNMSGGWSLTFTTSSGGCPTTAAGVTVAGRVITPEGYGLRNAIVTITDSTGMIRTARTSSFGYYTFEGIEVGGSYVMSVGSKLYTFTPRTLTVNDAMTDVDFIAQGSE